jgi:hypothetical protein
MGASFRDELARLADPAVAAAISDRTRALAASLSEVLASARPQDARKLLDLFVLTVLDVIRAGNPAAGSPSPPQHPLKTPVPSEVVVRALSDFDEEATLQEIRRIRETGGLALDDFYGELEQLVRPRE